MNDDLVEQLRALNKNLRDLIEKLPNNNGSLAPGWRVDHVHHGLPQAPYSQPYYGTGWPPNVGTSGG